MNDELRNELIEYMVGFRNEISEMNPKQIASNMKGVLSGAVESMHNKDTQGLMTALISFAAISGYITSYEKSDSPTPLMISECVSDTTNLYINELVDNLEESQEKF